MAGAHGGNDGSMDITQHRKTWSGFVKFIEWSIAGITILMLFLMVFRTHN